MRLHFRPFAPADTERCLALFDSNVPQAFDASERAGFASFLAELPCPYLVGETAEGLLVACGGWFREPHEPGLGGLAWGMVHRDWQGHGFGQRLLDVRLAALAGMHGIEQLVIRTSQHAEGFFARAGFVVTRRERDGHAPGIDFVEMRRPARLSASA